MDAIEYLKALLRETFTHFAGGLVGARNAYLESAKSHDTPLVRLASDEEVSLEMREAHERSMDDMWNSPACSDLVGNVYHHVH